MNEFQVLKFKGLTTIAPLTQRADAWMDFHGLGPIMDRANKLADGQRPLVEILTELLVADLGDQESEAYRRLGDMAARQRGAQQ